MDQLDFTDFFQTKAGASDFNTRLSLIAESVYKAGFSLEKALLQQIGVSKKDRFITILRDNNVDLESHTALLSFIAKLQEKISSLPVFSIKLAFEPKEITLRVISEWFIVNTKKQVLLDITVDENLIAGAAISFNGEYINLSVKEKFDQIAASILNKSEVPSTATVTAQDHLDTSNFSLGR